MFVTGPKVGKTILQQLEEANMFVTGPKVGKTVRGILQQCSS